MGTREEIVTAYLRKVSEQGRDLGRLLKQKPESGHEAAVRPSPHAQHAEAGLKNIESGRPLTQEQSSGLEAIILPKIRPVLDVVGGEFSTDHPLWQQKLNKGSVIHEDLKKTLRSIGRIELPGHAELPYGGTGFVVGPGLVMTNRHVAEIFTSGVGTRALSFLPGGRAGIDFLQEQDRPTGPTFMVRRVVMVHPYWDMALLSVEGLDEHPPLTLSQQEFNNAVDLAAIGYPAFDTRNPTNIQNDLFRHIFGVKRLQPGTLTGRRDTESFGKVVSAWGHDCSTLGGNSGSALVEMTTGEVVALHFGGRYQAMNYGVPMLELARDARVVDAGVVFKAPQKGDVPWASWWQRADNGSLNEARSSPAENQASPPPSGSDVVASGGTVRLTVPLNITISLGDPAAASVVAGETSPIGIEKMTMPWHDENYAHRDGYDKKFLGVEVLMPEPVDWKVAAHAKDNSQVLNYQNFSIVMHEKRRIALFTASNVTAEAALKKPDPDRTYSRKALSGLDDNDQERWFLDPRLDDIFQLPDVFYTRDDGAFDKGHIVRREDVAWGKTYDEVRRANGDTYHVTNCSPQVAAFNRSNLGDANWGQLENHVLKSAATERYCLFAGPVLDPYDEVFVGAGGGKVRLRVKIPSRFWKVVVVRTTAGIASYAFLLEQDLSDVPLDQEFVVPTKFRKSLVTIEKLQRMTGVRFDQSVLDSDQHDTDEGIELAMRTGLRRPADSP